MLRKPLEVLVGLVQQEHNVITHKISSDRFEEMEKLRIEMNKNSYRRAATGAPYYEYNIRVEHGYINVDKVIKRKEGQFNILSDLKNRVEGAITVIPPPSLGELEMLFSHLNQHTNMFCSPSLIRHIMISRFTEASDPRYNLIRDIVTICAERNSDYGRYMTFINGDQVKTIGNRNIICHTSKKTLEKN